MLYRGDFTKRVEGDILQSLNSAASTPYEIIGGAPTIRSAVERMYFWILKDDLLYNRYFRGVDMPGLKAHMVALLSQTLGGPKVYDGRSMSDAHAHLHIESEHYVRVGKYVVATLLVEQAPWEVIETVRDVLAQLEPAVCGA